MASGPKFGVGVGVFTDAKHTVGADHRFVESAQEVRLLLEASLDRDGSISGSLQTAQGDPRRFSGWLGLAAAITELAEPASGGSPQAARRPADLLPGGLEPRDEGPSAPPQR